MTSANMVKHESSSCYLESRIVLRYLHLNKQCRNGNAYLLQDGTKKSAQPGFVSVGGSSGGANANSQSDSGTIGCGAPTDGPADANCYSRTRLSRNREEEVRDAAVHNGTRLSGTLAPDARAAPVAPLWETEPANDARRRWEDSIEDRVQQSNNLLQQMHQMMSDRFAGDNVAHGGDNLVDDDVPPFPQMSHVTAMGQLEGDVAPVESTVPRVTASGLGAPWPSANGFETGVGGGPWKTTTRGSG